MKPRLYRMAWVPALLLLPTASWAFGGVGYVLQGMAYALLLLLAGMAVLVAYFAALAALPMQLAKPEPAASRRGQWAYGGLIGLLALLAGIAFYGFVQYVFQGVGGPYPGVLARSLPAICTLGLGVGAGVFLARRQRPTAARAMSGGLAAVGVGAWLIFHSHLLIKPAPLPRGIVGVPPIVDASTPADSFVVGETTAGKVYQRFDHPPGFQGGSLALKKMAGDELYYPDGGRAHGLVGIVQVTFIVQADGRLASPRVTTSLSAACDAEALRVLAVLAPYFTPGIEHGHPASMELMLSSRAKVSA